MFRVISLNEACRRGDTEISRNNGMSEEEDVSFM